MADEHKLRQQAERGRRASEILENDLVLEAFASVEKTIEEGWKNSAGDDQKARENAFLMHRLFQNFKQHFHTAVTNGNAAEKELLRIRDPNRLQRMFGNG